MQKLFIVALACFAVNAAATKFAAKAKLDINQKVYIENQPVLGDGAGAGALNKCRSFAAQHVSNPAAPAVRVCYVASPGGLQHSTRASCVCEFL